MKWIEHIAYYRGIRNEIPNQELAKVLADENNKEGIKEIVDYLYDKNTSVASDCIKVLYEIGYLKPDLIADYCDTFIDLLNSKQNRMVWGGMIAISTVAELKSDLLFKHLDLLRQRIEKGTVITSVSGILALIGMAKVSEENKLKLLPILFDYLENTRPVDFGRRVDHMLALVTSEDEKLVMDQILEMKLPELSDAQKKKLKTVVNKFNKKSDLKISFSI